MIVVEVAPRNVAPHILFFCYCEAIGLYSSTIPPRFLETKSAQDIWDLQNDVISSDA